MDEKKIKILLKLLLVIVFTGSSFFTLAETKKAENSAPQKEVNKQTNTPINPYSRGDINLHSIGLGVGQTFLHGDFEDNGDDQVTLDLFYNYSASHSFDFVTNLHYSKHKYKGHYAELPGLALSIKGKFYQFDSFAPFALGGLGFYLPKLRRTLADGQTIDTKSKITFGVNYGIGCELKLNQHFKLWIVLQHHNPFDIKQEVGPEVEGRYTKLLMAGLYTF